MADDHPSGGPGLQRWWSWVFLLTAGVVVALVAFSGYGQPELLLEAVNLRYCG